MQIFETESGPTSFNDWRPFFLCLRVSAFGDDWANYRPKRQQPPRRKAAALCGTGHAVGVVSLRVARMERDESPAASGCSRRPHMSGVSRVDGSGLSPSDLSHRFPIVFKKFAARVSRLVGGMNLVRL